MRVLVTGAFGYVGRAVTLRLLEAGHQVVAMTRAGRREIIPQFAAVQVVEADLRDRHQLRRAIEGVDGVCHLAALTRVRESFERPEEYRSVNVDGTSALLNVLTQARGRDDDGAGPIPFVQASTAAVYGAPETQPITEEAAATPASPYGESKLAAEAVVREHAAGGAIAAIGLRAFNIAGSVAGFGDPDESRIIPRTLLAAAGLRPPLTLNGDGSAVRDFVHVDDVARAYLLALSAPDNGRTAQLRIYNAYNVGATGASVREIIATVESVTGRQVPIVRRPPQSEVPMLLADTGRIREELGWKPERSSLAEIVTDTWAAIPH